MSIVVDLDRVQRALRQFIERERTRFENVARTATQALEIGALVIVAEHYKRDGWTVAPRNLRAGLFRTKLSASGYAWNFSWFECSNGSTRIEVHGNLSVESATPLDAGVYVVDVAVVRGGQVDGLREAASPGDRNPKKSVTNEDTISFVEAKKLVIYPMLLAQFVGIVHEIKPSYLDPSKSREVEDLAKDKHILPTLVSVGPLAGTSLEIINGFARRGFRLNIIPTFDLWISNMIDDPTVASPFRTGAVSAPEEFIWGERRFRFGSRE
jgi:hypothetical protein